MHWRPTLRLAACSFALFTAAPTAALENPAKPRTPPHPLPPPTSAELRDDTPRQRRWMTLPGSRVVVNPYNYLSRDLPLKQSEGEGLPLHVGYYAARSAVTWPDLLMLYAASPGTAPITTEWEDRFSPEETGWDAGSNGHVLFPDGTGVLELTTTGPMEGCPTCAAATRRVTIDLDRSPWLQIQVPKAEGKWALKVRDVETTEEIILQRDTDQTGPFAYNVAKSTGWKGRKSFDILLFAIGIDKPVTLSSLRFVGFDKAMRTGAASQGSSWTPHELVTTATFPNSSRITVRDRFYDTDTLIRIHEIAPLDGKDSITSFALAGRYRGFARWDADRRVLSVDGTTGTYAVAIGNSARSAKAVFYPTLVEFQSGQPQTLATASIWTIEASIGPEQGNRLVCSVGFATPGEGREVAINRALQPFRSDDWEKKTAAQESFWDDFLAKVPRPARFDLCAVDPLGVTPQEIRRDYYAAWVFTAANLLPAMPESGFHYPQLGCGKPSMWLEGHRMAPATASWESLFAMQFYAYIDPDMAWKAFEGLMSLVDEPGRIGGESLPSRKAQTAHVLYALSGDRERLAGIYEPLKRHLLWARENPRWIHGPHDFPDEKDADFVASLLYDLSHMQRIAEVLKRADEAAFWRDQRESLLADYYRWFWTDEKQPPAQIYMANKGTRSWGNSSWVASGLGVSDVQPGPHADGLVARLDFDYHPAKPLAGLGIPKYPEVGLLVYGLHDRGLKERASIIANIAVRDVVRSNMFAEQYFTQEFPHPDGVRPSMFGAAMLIDMIWLKNGYRMEGATPAAMTLPEESGRVENLLIRGRRLDWAAQ